MPAIPRTICFLLLLLLSNEMEICIDSARWIERTTWLSSGMPAIFIGRPWRATKTRKNICDVPIECIFYTEKIYIIENFYRISPQNSASVYIRSAYATKGMSPAWRGFLAAFILMKRAFIVICRCFSYIDSIQLTRTFQLYRYNLYKIHFICLFIDADSFLLESKSERERARVKRVSWFRSSCTIYA